MNGAAIFGYQRSITLSAARNVDRNIGIDRGKKRARKKKGLEILLKWAAGCAPA